MLSIPAILSMIILVVGVVFEAHDLSPLVAANNADKGNFSLFVCLYFIACKTSVKCASVNDTKALLFDLLFNYDINVRPVADQNMSVNVSIQPYIKSIQEFDEVRGKFAFAGALEIVWHDVNMMWNPEFYCDIYEVTVLYPSVWIPELVLSSPSDNVDSLGKKWHRIRYSYDGMAVWFPVDLFESTCSVNVRNYPFDTQMCVTSFNSFAYYDYELVFEAASDEFSFEFYQKSSVWEIVETKVSVTEVGGGSQINLILYLNRKPLFIVINVIMPILFLSLLNVLVFLLIPESGERVSYCITVLLSISVFMTIVSDMLPRSSEPVPIISFKLMTDMVISSFIVLVTIINLKWYHKNDNLPIPRWLKTLFKGCKCICCCRRKVTPGEKVKRFPDGSVEKLDGISDVIEATNEEEQITWKQISSMVDKLALVGFTVASLSSFVIFFVITSTSLD